MKRTTIFMPEELEAELRRYARHKQQPVAWVVREAVTAYLARDPDRFRMPAFTGVFSSGRSDIAERAEELLFQDLTPHDDRIRRPKRVARPRPAKRKRRE